MVRNANPLWFAAAFVFQIGTYLAVAAVLRILTLHLGHAIPLRRLLRLAVVTVFLNNAFPAGGASGATFLSRTLRRDGVPVAASLLLTTVYYLASWSSFLVFLAVTFTYLLATHTLTSWQLAAGLTALGLAAVFVGLLAFLANGGQRVVSVAARIARWLKRDPDDVRRAVATFHQGFTNVLHAPDIRVRVIMASGLEQILDLLTVGALFLTFGIPVPLGVLTVGFFLANFVTWLSFIPTGLGIFEGSLVGIYTALGVPFEAAAIVVLVYRALSFWLPIPFGFTLYQHLLHEVREPLQSTAKPVG